MGVAGFGLTVIIKVACFEHPFLEAVTRIVAVIGACVLLAALKLAMFPLPLLPSPMAVLLFVQVNVVPLSKLEKTNCPVAEPAQYEVSVGIVRSGTGLTVSCWVRVVVPQLFVAERKIACLPVSAKETKPGFEVFDIEGMPPAKVQE